MSAGLICTPYMHIKYDIIYKSNQCTLGCTLEAAGWHLASYVSGDSQLCVWGQPVICLVIGHFSEPISCEKVGETLILQSNRSSKIKCKTQINRIEQRTQN